MLLEEQRFIHEDLERLEQAVADRVAEDPRNIRVRLSRDHEVAQFLERIETQSKRLLETYQDADGLREKEIQSISTGDQFEEFYKQLGEIKEHHKRYPNEPIENLEQAYNRRQPGEGEAPRTGIDNMFNGEEGFGQYLDLTPFHKDYLNLPNVKRLNYVQYLEIFDSFTPPAMPIKRNDKTSSDRYFSYVGELAAYLESFIKRVQPLQPLDELFASFDKEFEKQWSAKEVPGWTEEKTENGTSGPATEGTGEGMWCPDCEKEFKNENVYRNHLPGKKHIRLAEARKAAGSTDAKPSASQLRSSAHSLKEREVARREHQIRSLTNVLHEERQATRINVERRQGMTERERQAELEAIQAGLYNTGPEANGGEESDNDDEEQVYNPLKLPLAWDGKPIPFWLYKLHGLGVEYPCEICGNFTYMGRRAFDKHFSESLHIYGLKCLGITSNTNLFREITSINEAIALWEQLDKDRKKERDSRENVVQMEDAEGNVMPERIYLDLQKQGIL
ncbi:hypothetical protein N7457_001874 [Penicillium paradoxum]|uniref:uncharacterized protein n=1 Tax=Penicillium paradoxum TaxID=176176 RepID=UPI002548395C|nr:uncharacterized protein N7457_001874 [Penicillium paradoxum]KAJ5795275.1 hypothetical protein N7457_001874 [Penicillium paradoxum]